MVIELSVLKVAIQTVQTPNKLYRLVLTTPIAIKSGRIPRLILGFRRGGMPLQILLLATTNTRKDAIGSSGTAMQRNRAQESGAIKGNCP